MTNKILPIIIFILICGCSAANPVVPDYSPEMCGVTAADTGNPHGLWGYYNLVFDSEHTRCDVYPVRAASFHLNGLKFLEQTPCTNCLSVSNFNKPEDEVIELDVTIRHPFAALEYSCFDVKGIIMFNGSWKCGTGLSQGYPELSWHLVSWAPLGDWELINADGYSYYWSPIFNPDSEWPITQYMPGKFANGTPTAAVNACKDFYTDETRHLFRAGGIVTRTYRIQTQPGPMVVGYAIDACWAPPTKTPVTNPLEDFPSSANAPEPYFFDIFINNGEPIVDPHEPDDDRKVHVIIKQWNGLTVDELLGEMEFEVPMMFPYDGDDRDEHWWLGGKVEDCGLWEDHYCDLDGIGLDVRPPYEPAPEGWYRVIVSVNGGHSWTGFYDFAVDITDFYYDPE